MTSSHPFTGRTGPTWVVTLSSGGVERGMVGPFPDAASAETWAEAAVVGQPGCTWRCEPVVAPEALTTGPQREPDGRTRRHLRVVA